LRILDNSVGADNSEVKKSTSPELSSALLVGDEA
jgi:hypothetical protein